MYESISYSELKSLPRAQKSDAWKELKTLYSTQKELAQKLGVSPAIVSSMLSRYAGDESAGSKKSKRLKVMKESERAGRRNRKRAMQEIGEGDAALIETRPDAQGNKDVESDSFSISIKKMVSGEDAQVLLNGLGSTLLKDQKYVIEMRITE